MSRIRPVSLSAGDYGQLKLVEINNSAYYVILYAS